MKEPKEFSVALATRDNKGRIVLAFIDGLPRAVEPVALLTCSRDVALNLVAVVVNELAE